MRNKSAETTSQAMAQKHSQATEEQIRVAKLSQMNKDSHEDEIRMVLDITQKPLDIVSLALHDSNYDQALAISNIFEGKYDEHQDEWQTTSTKRGKKLTTNHDVDKADSIDLFSENEQKPNNTKNISRGGKGRPPRNQRDDRFSDQRRDGSEERSDMSRDRNRGTADRGRGQRGRGRGGPRGGVRGGRGGFGRGGGASSRGGRQPGRGAGRGGGNRRRDGGRREENGEPSSDGGFGVPGSGFGEPSSGGFGNPGKEEETWDIEEKAEEDWATENTVPSTDTKPESNWSKNWGDEEMEPEIKSDKVDSLFSQKADWGHVNGTTTDEWADKEQNAGKYVPEQIDPAVISSIPTSATSAEVTSYQPTNDINRYISNNAPSNQFPSSQQEGGLTSSLSENDFTSLAESLQQNLASLPMISGITESHKLEEEQRYAKTQQLKAPRKPISKNTVQSGQPVVMPRSAKHVHDVEEQFTGLEFGSGPVSPRLLKIANSSVTFTNDLNNTESLKNFGVRQPVADLQASSTTPAQLSTQQEIGSHPILPATHPILPPVVQQSTETTSVQDATTDKITGSLSSSLNAFKSLESSGSDSKSPHYIGSPGRGIAHNLATDPIPFPSSTNLPSSPTSSASSALDVFSRHSGLGTSVTMTMENSQQNISSYHDSKVYGTAHTSLNEQHHRDQTITEQRAAFAEQKALAQQKLLQSQRSKDDSRPVNSTPPDNTLNSSLNEKRKTISEPSRLGLTETGSLQTKENSPKAASNDSSYSNKGHRSTNPRSISSPPGLSSSVYASNTSSKGAELLSQVTSSASASTSKSQSKAGNAPPGMIHPNLLPYPGVQPGMLPAAYQQLHGYNNYDEILQLHRQQVQHLPQSPYHYDVSTMYPTAATAAASREGIAASYQAAETKFARASGEDSTNLHQANAHVAANNMNAHQAAYMNAAGQLPYGYAYYQAVPQAPGLYPAFTAPNVFMNQGGGKAVVGTQYQQYAQQQSFNNIKYSGSASQDFPKGNYHNSSSSQTTLTKSGNQGGPSSDAGQSAYKVQGYNDGKGFLGSSPSSQPGMNMHGQNTQHLNHAYLLAQQQQQQVSVSQMGHQGAGGHDSRGGHQASYSGNPQKRGGEGKGNSYQSYWNQTSR